MENIFIFIYQRYGFSFYLEVLSDIESPLVDNHNPLRDVLENAFSNL